MNLVVSPVAGGEARKRGPVLSYEWSPEGERLVFTTKTTLQVTDFATGAGRILARRGDVEGFGFAPGGSYVFGSWRGKERSLRSDIYAVGLKGKVRRLTHDGHSGQPVWGRNWIAYRRFHTERGSRWPVSDIWLMRPDGTGKRQLAGVSPTAPSGVFFGHRQLAVIGLMPLRFSADDKHLLACAASGLLCQAVTIAVPDGTLHKLRVPGTYAQAWGLSGDGRDVLVQASRSFDARDASVYSIPVDGGAPRLLVPDAAQPSWALR